MLTTVSCIDYVQLPKSVDDLYAICREIAAATHSTVAIRSVGVNRSIENLGIYCPTFSFQLTIPTSARQFRT